MKEVATKLAKGRTVVSTRDRVTDGIRFYDMEFKSEDQHELRTLCIHKSKLFNLAASVPEKKWSKREEQLKSVILSFVPKL